MARSERIRTRCPKCKRAWLRVEAGGTCGAVMNKGWCDGIVEAVTPNAPRHTQGRPRVRMGVNLLPETAEALTATEVAALADGHVKDGGTDG